MLTEKVRPSTLNGIKRRAKQLKKAYSIHHHEALDIAAKEAGYENYNHARNCLTNKNLSISTHQLFFTVYWYDRESHERGRELLEIELSKPLLDTATKNELKYSNGLAGFRLASPDHFVSDVVIHSKQAAVEKICKAVRTLRFMEATGLKPSQDIFAAYPEKDPKNRLPKTDHATDWYDPKTGQFILIDEPYPNSVFNAEREEWAAKHKWSLQPSKWPGMYFPGMSKLYVATDATTGYDFDGLMSKIDNIPQPLTLENWTGTSAEGHETFYSPLCKTPQDKNRAVAKGTIYRTSSKKTAPMRYWDSVDNQRRPNAKMSVENHQLAARMIRAIEVSVAKPRTVNNRLSSIKSTLEDWFLAEHSRKITDLYDYFYYGEIDGNDPFISQVASSKGVVELLKQLKRLLEECYVDCEPLRRMTGKLTTSIKLTSMVI